MRNLDFGLSNQYLKFGLGLLLLGPAMIVFAAVLGSDSTLNLMTLGLVFFITGVVVYVIGRIIKAASHVRE